MSFPYTTSFASALVILNGSASSGNGATDKGRKPRRSTHRRIDVLQDGTQQHSCRAPAATASRSTRSKSRCPTYSPWYVGLTHKKRTSHLFPATLKAATPSLAPSCSTPRPEAASTATHRIETSPSIASTVSTSIISPSLNASPTLVSSGLWACLIMVQTSRATSGSFVAPSMPAATARTPSPTKASDCATTLTCSARLSTRSRLSASFCDMGLTSVFSRF
mmetsp:Transcript_10555/g.31282  ORF Transcript_10555/g.31282 Transcript_10555/m.31282 type:complete len:221 (-) Transcript_10555:217-879(-)